MGGQIYQYTCRLVDVKVKYYDIDKVSTKLPKCSQWAVVTSIFAPNEVVKAWASLLEWCAVVVVADTKSTLQSYPTGYRGLSSGSYICISFDGRTDASI